MNNIIIGLKRLKTLTNANYRPSIYLIMRIISSYKHLIQIKLYVKEAYKDQSAYIHIYNIISGYLVMRQNW